MPSSYPTSLDSFSDPAPADPRVGHASQHANANDAIEAIEANVGISGSANTGTIEWILKNASSVSPGHKHAAADLVSLDGSKLAAGSVTPASFNSDILYGWYAAGETWAYSSATAIQVTGDLTAKYAPGDKLRFVQSAVTKYCYVQSAAFAAGTTTLTVKNGIDGGTVVANSAITSNYFSKAETPPGFPSTATFYDKCKARLSGAPAFTAASGGTTFIPWADSYYDTNAMHSSSVNNSRVTFKSPGVYVVLCGLQISPPAVANGLPNLQITVNGTTVNNANYQNGFSSMATTGFYTEIQISSTLQVSAGDYAEIAFNQFTGSTLQANVGSGDWFSVTQTK